jgi:hypothetical protein
VREGRIERAIRGQLQAHPDEAFTTDDLALACYPEIDPEWRVERKYRVAVVRAADKVLAADPDWYRCASRDRGRMAIFANAASVRSTVMASLLQPNAYANRPWVEERIRAIFNATSGWDPERLKDCQTRVSQHIAIRDAADEAERERLRYEHQTLNELRALALASFTGVPGPRRTPSSGPRPDNTRTLAAKARALISENDPDAVRKGLAEIADALERLAA